MNQRSYEDEERRKFQNQIMDTEIAPLWERKEAETAFAEAMRDDPALVAERIGWMLNGSYGYGAYVVAGEVAQNTRMNRAAWMVQTVGALEWACPADRTRRAWKSLTDAQKAELDRLVMAEIGDYLREQAEEKETVTA